MVLNQSRHGVLASGFALALGLAAGVRAGPPFYVGAEEADREFSRITAADMAVIRNKHVLLASRSFGLNIMNGIGLLAAENPMYQINRSPSYDVNNGAEIPADVFDTYDFVHYLCTLNPDQSRTRLAEIDNLVRNRYHGQLDAIMVEYHWCSPTAFPDYQATLDGIRRDFPHIKVIYVTSGYMLDEFYHANNQTSAQFGALSRAAYMGVQPFYDMARLLGSDEDAVWVGDFLLNQYNLNYPNGDNIHPNTAFIQKRMGRAMLLTLYKMFCEPPLRANAGPDQFVIDTDSDGSCAVTLDGTDSYCQDGNIVNYTWKIGTQTIATGPAPQITLPYGTHNISLFVTDDRGNTDRDDVQIVTKARSIRVVYQIAASADDTNFTSATSGYSFAGTVMYYPYNEGERRSAMRWAVNIPKGSTILEAKVIARSDGQQNVAQRPPIIEFSLYDYDNCPAFSSNPWSWARTATTVTWNTTQVLWTASEWYESSNLAALVQEFIDRPGYAPGKYLGLHTKGIQPPHSWRTVYQWDFGDHSSGAKLEILFAEPEPNRPPIADAGPSQLAHDTDRDGQVTITLDGSGSFDPDGTIASYVWKRGATPIATGVTAAVTLTPGLHSLTLVVTDNEGATGEDTVAIQVNTPPLANAGADQVVRADATRFARVTLDGSASSDPDPDGILTELHWWNGATFLGGDVRRTREVSLGVGVHTLRLVVVDDAGGTDEDTVQVTVLTAEGFMDANGNDVDDAWEARYWPEGPAPDTVVKRGVEMNLREVFVANLDPFDDDSFFAITECRADGRNVFTTALDRRYTVEWSDDLRHRESWQPLTGYVDVPGTGTPLEAVVPDVSPCFVRVRVRLPPPPGSPP